MLLLNRVRSGGIGAAFSDRNFRIYSIGSIGSWMSFFIQVVTVSWLAWELTGSTRWLAVIALLDIVPNVVLMPFAGTLADRFDRHKILIITSVLCLLQAAALTLVSGLVLMNIWLLALLVFFHGVFITFMVPAMYGTVPRFVARSKVASAIAVSSSYSHLALFIGPAIAGWIILSYGVTIAFMINVLGYVVLIIALFRLRTPADYQPPKPSARSFLGDIADGFRYLWVTEGLVPLFVISMAANTLLYGFIEMLPAYADTILKQGLVGFTVILAMRGLGAVCAALWLAHSGEKNVRLSLVIWAFLAAILALGAILQTTSLYLAGIIAVLLGFANETRKTASFTIIQLKISEEQRGRVTGAVFMMGQLASGISTYLIGEFAVEAGVRTPMLIGVGIVLIIWCIVYIWFRRVGDKITTI